MEASGLIVVDLYGRQEAELGKTGNGGDTED